MFGSRNLSFALALVSLCATPLSMAVDAPEKALKYHEALLKRPHNASLFDRFFGAWLDEQPVESLAEYLKAQANKNGGQDWTVLALFEIRQGREEEALVALGKAIEAVPDDPALLMDRAKLRLRRLEFEAARADLAKVAAGKDETLSREASKLIGRAWLREGKSEEAIKAWDAVLAAHPDDEDLLEDLVEAAAAESETKQALVYAGKLVEASRDPYQKTLRMLRRGDLLSNAGQNDEAVEVYSATLEQVGEGSWLEREVLGQIEKVFRKQDRLDELSAELKKLAEAYPRRLLIQRQLAKLEAAQGETDTAVGRFREVLKRSPGERELREEFVRLLSDGERFDEAVEEIGKLIELAPTEAGLHLQVAALRARQSKRDEVQAALGKAYDLLGRNESNGIRIAGLMLQYGLNDQGEVLLKELGSAQGAGPAAMEALAAHYARTTRKDEAIEVLKKLSGGGDLELLLRTSSALAALGENATSFERLFSRVESFGSDSRFVAALGQAAMAAGKSAEVVPQMLKLVRQAKQSGEIADGVGLALRVINAGGKSDELRANLTVQQQRTPGEICLLAALLEEHADFEGVAKLLDPQTDPQVIHFQAALLDRRGEFDAAVVVLTKLADTEEGRKAGYFKDLSALQQRAGKTNDALATVERWKQNAPGDKAAWVTSSQLLRQSGKPEDAVKMTRQAVARFEGDADLAASLASLHDEAGHWSDAEAIYWRLYDEAQSATDQSRWAAQLARVAQQTGKTTELEEKFRERARSNRKSIGPLLAQAELARLLDDEDKRRDLLLEAVRLQPKDVDLRLQIATLEEQAGNPERVVALLEEALPNDMNGRVRSALAQAYLRQGQTMKGMRELLSLAGKGGSDPRSVEGAVKTLIAGGSFEDAIRYVREILPDGGDWRSRYLLAALLEKDGRESEAQPIFLSLLNSEGEIPSLKSASTQDLSERYPKEVRDLIRLITSVQAAFMNRPSLSNPRARGTEIALPDSVEEVRSLSMVRLSLLAGKSGAGGAGGLIAQMKAQGVSNPEFLMALIDSSKEGRPDLKSLLEKFPSSPGLLELAVMYSDLDLDKKLVSRLIEEKRSLSPYAMFLARMRLVEGEPAESPAWPSFLEAAKAACRGGELEMRIYVLSVLTRMLGGTEVPEVHRVALKKLALGFFDSATPQPDVSAEALAYYRLATAATVGEASDWLETTNAALRLPRTNARQAASLSSIDPEEMGVPKFESLPLQSLPAWLPRLLASGAERLPGSNSVKVVAELFKVRDKIESPLLRAWLAMSVKDDAATREALAVEAPAAEAGDFQLLRAMQAIKDSKPMDAFTILDKQRLAGNRDPSFNAWLLSSMLAVAETIPAAERAPLAETFKAFLLQYRVIAGPKGGESLALIATKLGLGEFSTRLNPPVAKSSSGPRTVRSRTSSGGSTSPLDRLTKLVLENKPEAAALEAQQLLKAARSSSGYSDSSPKKIVALLSPPVREALLKLVAPGDSKSLVKRLDYVDVCLNLGRRDLALETLQALAIERPEDPEIACRLAFNLPAEKKAEQRALLTRAAASREFAASASEAAEAVEDGDDTAAFLSFFDSITGWLETADASVIQGPNLGWVSQHARRFFDPGYSHSLPSLLGRGRVMMDRNTNKGNVDRRNGIARRLAEAMLRHPDLAEEGFQLLCASNAWQFGPFELDAQARRALLAAIQPPVGGSGAPNSPGGLSQNNISWLIGSMGGNVSLENYGSLQWIVNRLSQVQDPADILPSAYLEELRQANPPTGALITSMVGMKKVSELTPLLESANRVSGLRASMSEPLKDAVLLRAASLPGAAPHFLEQLRKLPANERYTTTDSSLPLMRGALVAGLKFKDQELETIVGQVGKTLYSRFIDWSQQEQAKLGRMDLMVADKLLRSGFEPASLVRLLRAFYRLGLPVGDSEDIAIEPFKDLKLKSAEEAERFLESIGWLTDAADWTPFAVAWVESNFSGGQMQPTPTSQMRLEEALDAMNLGTMRQPLIQRLKERKAGRFGSLMIAAALSERKDRLILAGQALREAAPTLSKVPKARITEWMMVASWFPRDALGSLPASAREFLAGPEEQEMKKAIAEAEKLLAAPDAGVDGKALFNAINPLVQKIAPHDLTKALNIFIAADRRFTEGLSKGGKLCTEMADDFELPERDLALARLVDGDESDGLLSKDHNLGFQFLAKLMASPDGGRFAYVARSSELFYPDLLTSIGHTMYNEAMAGRSDLYQQYQRLIPMIGRMDEEVRDHASIAVFAGFSKFWPDLEEVAVTGQRKIINGLRKDHPRVARFADVAAGATGFPGDKPEGQAATFKAFEGIMQDKSIPAYPRLAFGISNATRRLQLLYDQPSLETIAELYEQYCRADRSAVNYTSHCLFRNIGFCSLSRASQPTIRRIYQAFWANANRVQPGGHPVIPEVMLPELLRAAAYCGDVETTKRLLASCRKDLVGNTGFIVKLLMGGQFELVDQVLPTESQTYDARPWLVNYTSELEAAVQEYEALDTDTVKLARLEAVLADLHVGSGPLQPKSSFRDRILRVALLAKKGLPKNPIGQAQLLSRLLLADDVISTDFEEAAVAWSKNRSFKTILSEWTTKKELPGVAMTPNDFFLVQYPIQIRGAIRAMGDGDVSLLKSLRDGVMVSNPADSFAEKIQANLLKNISGYSLRPLVVMVIEGRTKGFAEAVPIYGDLAVYAATTKLEMKPETLGQSLLICRFLANWSGRPELYDEVVKRLPPARQAAAAKLADQDVLAKLVSSGGYQPWKTAEGLAPTRKAFLAKVLTRKELAPLLPVDGGWIKSLEAAYPDGEFSSLVAISSDDWIPEVRPAVRWYVARRLWDAGQAQVAEARFRSSIEDSQGEAFDKPRGVAKADLVELLLASGKADEARQVRASITPAETSEPLKARLKILTDKLSTNEQAKPK